MFKKFTFFMYNIIEEKYFFLECESKRNIF